jgi:hypothetical protein
MKKICNALDSKSSGTFCSMWVRIPPPAYQISMISSEKSRRRKSLEGVMRKDKFSLKFFSD